MVVPLERRHDWDEVKGFFEALAKRMASHEPNRYIAKATKTARAGRIFLDYLCNGRGATAIAPYSMRAREGAPVAVPLRWDELGSASRGDRYRVGDLARRLGSLEGDPWEGYDSLRQRLTKGAGRALGLET